ncbi:hypothetical protein HY969_03700 [Candidatus Kaiserbacteria bacterium]|nr:hypothetical protein [Candidatus Kaiserbacteria bacterium]
MSDVPPKFPRREAPRIPGPEQKKPEQIRPPSAQAPRPLTTPAPQAKIDNRTDEQKRLDARRNALVAKSHEDARIIEGIERLESSREGYLQIIRDAGIKIGAPTWEAVSEKASPFGIGRSIREGKKIKNIVEKVGIGKNERVSLLKYRDWLISRVGEKIGGNVPGTRPAGIERLLADVLRYEYKIGEEPVTDPKKEAIREKTRQKALSILRGLKIEEPHIVDRIKRALNVERKAWIYTPPLSLHGGYFFVRPDAEPKDIHRAIEAAMEERKPRQQKTRSKKKQKAPKKR